MLPSLNIIENVVVPSIFAKNDNGGRFKKAEELLETVGLEGRMKAYPRQLSAGELRRVALARAMMNKPEILLADEPTADLDEQTELKIVSVLQKVHETGVTILMITHSLELVPYATRALRMEDGNLTPFERTPHKAQPAVVK
jgi:ABC-type lipoprotein export system ATPase subunit